MVKKISDSPDKRTSALIPSNSIRTEALARAGIQLRRKNTLEDRASTQGGMDSQEDDINTTKSSKWMQKDGGLNERSLDNVTVSLGGTKQLNDSKNLGDISESGEMYPGILQSSEKKGMKTNSFVKNVASEIQVAIGSHNSTTGYFNQPQSRSNEGNLSSLNIEDSHNSEVRPSSREAKMKLMYNQEYSLTKVEQENKKHVKINEEETVINM